MTFVIYYVYNCTHSRSLVHSGLGFYYVYKTMCTSDLLCVQSIVHNRSKASSIMCTSDLLFVQSPELAFDLVSTIDMIYYVRSLLTFQNSKQSREELYVYIHMLYIYIYEVARGVSHIYKYIYIYVLSREESIYTCTCVCIYIYLSMYMCVCIYIYIYICLCT